MPVKMIAKKNFRFKSVSYKENQEFSVAPRWGKVLRALDRARYVPDDDVLAPARPTSDEKRKDPELVAARENYMRVHGKRPYHAWDVATLRDKVAGYERRDMQARSY